MMTTTKWLLVASALAALPALPACGGGSDTNNPTADANTGDGGTTDEWDQRLGERQYDYHAALRIASLRLQGELPNMTDIATITAAADVAGQKAAYETLVQKYMTGPKFATQMLGFWRDTFKIGESPAFDTAPVFATQLTVENRSYLELLTASSGNCPTIDMATGNFTAADCASGAPANVGVLTNPSIMRSFYSNFAFRRGKWLQEAFACTKFPAETAAPIDVGNPTNLYASPWAFDSISGLETGRINFKDVSAVVCANCHATLNHLAPLFANFDDKGMYQAQIAVKTPIEGGAVAKITDYYPATETTAWRFGKPAADLTALGAAMAADPDITDCAVARAWNFAMGKTDIVDTLQVVPKATIATQVTQFAANGHKLKDLIFAVFTSDDFTKF